jgi:hypothetical protein
MNKCIVGLDINVEAAHRSRIVDEDTDSEGLTGSKTKRRRTGWTVRSHSGGCDTDLPSPGKPGRVSRGEGLCTNEERSEKEGQ